MSDPALDTTVDLPPSRVGRKRDAALNGRIIDATLCVLAENGYEHMTIDMVAARAGSARATVYRRWPSKADLVFDAVSRLSRADAGDGGLPAETGDLREELIAMILPLSEREQQVRIEAVAGLLALAKTEERLAGAAQAGITPWIELNRRLIERAVQRGEFPPPADLAALAELIPMLCISRAVQHRPIDREFSVALIDGVLIPALRGGAARNAFPTQEEPR